MKAATKSRARLGYVNTSMNALNRKVIVDFSFASRTLVDSRGKIRASRLSL